VVSSLFSCCVWSPEAFVFLGSYFYYFCVFLSAFGDLWFSFSLSYTFLADKISTRNLRTTQGNASPDDTIMESWSVCFSFFFSVSFLSITPIFFLSAFRLPVLLLFTQVYIYRTLYLVCTIFIFDKYYQKRLRLFSAICSVSTWPSRPSITMTRFLHFFWHPQNQLPKVVRIVCSAPDIWLDLTVITSK
jgi:hypothetical protein